MKRPRTFKYGGMGLRLGPTRQGAEPVPNAFLPNIALILMKQHGGSAARCVVRRGEYVREGTVIGRASDESSSNVHASIPGKVLDIRPMPLPDGGSSEAVVIGLEGAFDLLGRRPERYLWKTMSRHDILHSLEDRGVVDTEPPGRSFVRLIAQRTEMDLLVLNAMESEPFLDTEASIFRDKRSEVLDGMDIVRKVVNPARAAVAVEAGSASALPIERPDGEAAPELIELEPRYPQDLPNQLLEAIGGSKPAVKSRAIILRPSTALAVFEAIVHVKPLLERYVTVAGGAIRRPSVLKARIGTPIGDLVQECGGFSEPPARLVVGGPLRGSAVHDLGMPVTKTTSAVLALAIGEIGRNKRIPCIRCGRCTRACPERLSPERLYRLLGHGREGEAMVARLSECTLCGLCGHVCPSRVPLVATFAGVLRPRSARTPEAAR